MKRILVFGLCFLLSSLLLFMVSPIGFHLTIQAIQKNIPGTLTFSKIEGNIFGPIHISDLDYVKNEGPTPIHVHVKDALLEWHLPMLLLGKIDISSLTLQDINISRPFPLALQHAILKVRGKPNRYAIELQTVHAHHTVTVEAYGNKQQIHFTLDSPQSTHLAATTQVIGTLHWLPRWEININGNTVINNHTLHVSGGYHHAWDLAWDLQGKTIQSTGALTGSEFYKPFITAQIHAQDIEYNGLSAQSLAARMQVDLSYHHPSHLDITLQQALWKTLQAHSIRLHIEGLDPVHPIHAQLQVAQQNGHSASFATTVQGKQQGSTWVGELRKLQFQATGTPAWSLEKTSVLLFPNTDQTIWKNIILKNICLSSSNGRICGGGHYTSLWDFWITGKLFNLNRFSSWMQPGLHVNLPAHFNVKMGGKDNKIEKIDLLFNTAKGSIAYSNFLQTYILPIQKINFNSHINQTDIKAQTQISLGENNYFFITMGSPRAHLEKMHTHIGLSFSKLQPLELFLPSIANVRGGIIGDFDITGLWNAPQINGNLGIKNGYIEVPELHVRLNNINAALDATHQKVAYTIKAMIDAKPIKIVGAASFENNSFNNRADITGENLLVFNTGEYNIHASPRLTLQTHQNRTQISGVITIPQALIKPIDFSTTTTLPDEIEIIGRETEKQKEKNSIWNAALNIKIILGKEVFIHSKGLKSRATGTCILTRTPEQPSMTGNGTVHLSEATFSTQGKILTLSADSNVHWNNDLITNPRLAIQAYRIVTVIATPKNAAMGGKTKVGASIEGTAKQPTVNFFSIPIALSQGDIISYLLFDQPSSDGTSTESLSLLIQAASNLKLSGRGSNFSISQIKQTLGITELGVQQQTYLDALGTPLGINQSSFVIGSYITPKIHLRYNHGILTDINIYQVQYSIDGRWSVQMETYYGNNSLDNGSGLDVIYTVSRKKFF